jgi:hypothetical protein
VPGSYGAVRAFTDRPSCLMGYGNRDEQLLRLPGNGVPLESQVIVSSSVAQPHGEAPLDVHSVNSALESNETSLAVCPDGHVRFAAHCASVAEKGTVTVAIARPFFDSTSVDEVELVASVFFFASLVQLPPPPAQAQFRSLSTVARTQMSVFPRPLTSTLTPNGVVLHEKSLTLKACARASVGAMAIIAAAAIAMTGTNRRVDANHP